MAIDFTDFYLPVLEEMDIDSTQLENSRKVVKNAYSFENLRNGNSKISFSCREERYAYLYEYGPCFSSTVAHEFENMLDAHRETVERLIRCKSLKICCLGGGPATEVVAISKVLEKTLIKYGLNHGTPFLLEATIVDINPSWVEIVDIIEEKLTEFVDQSVLEVSFTYVECDLVQQPLPDEVLDILKESEVVTMVKFMSAVYGAQPSVEGEKVVKEVVKCLTENSVLFFLDSSGFLQLSNLFVNLCCCVDTMVIYHNSNSVYNLDSLSLVHYVLNLPIHALPCVTSKNRVLALTKNPKEDNYD